MLRRLSFLLALAAAFAVSVGPPAVAARQRVRPCSAGLVALTFDDGPSATATPRLVGILKRAHVPATFFMVGERVRAAPEAARLVAREGFTIGDHTWDHKELTLISDPVIRGELRSTAKALRAAHVHPSHLMRPPYGALNARVRALLKAMDLSPVLWTIDTRDWAGGTATQIATRALDGLHPHGDNVVLQHDGVANSPNSVSAVPRIIRGARARGYCFTVVGRDGRPVVPRPTARVHITPGVEGQRSRAITVRVQLSRATSRTVSMRIRTSDVTAVAGEDYRPVSRRVTFRPGATNAAVRIKVREDRLTERSEHVGIDFTRPRGLQLKRTHYLAGIRSDDPGTADPLTTIVHPPAWYLSGEVLSPKRPARGRFRVAQRRKPATQFVAIRPARFRAVRVPS